MAIKILVANPCDAERELVSHVLRGEEFEVLTAASIEQLCAVARDPDVQLVVLDGLCWQKNILKALQALKTDPQTRPIPVMIFCNPQKEEDVYDALNGGASAWFVRKGFELEKFVAKVRKTQGRKVEKPKEAVPAQEPAAVGLPPGLEKLDEATVLNALSSTDYLPAFNFSITEAMTTTCSRENAVRHMAEIVMRDPMMSLAMLSRANRIKPGERKDDIAETHEAAAVLGLQEFTRLAEAVWPLEYNIAGLWEPGSFWLHSVATARIGGLLSRMLGFTKTNQAFNAGLLHDMGYFVLATLFPKHFGALYSSAGSADNVHPVWEKRLIGAHHGEIGAWVMQHFHLPEMYRNVAMVHHVPGVIGPGMNGSTRVVSLIVQAADQLADALFPADPPLTSLTVLSEDFLAALDHADISAARVVDEARKIVAELMTEMVYLFPQAARRNFFYRQEPLKNLLYYAPRAPHLDLIRTFCDVRSEEVTGYTNKSGERTYPEDWPMVVNLAYVRDTAAQVETLSVLAAAGELRRRKGVILVADKVEPVIEQLIGDTWHIYSLPTQPARWMRTLMPKADEAKTRTPELVA